MTFVPIVSLQGGGLSFFEITIHSVFLQFIVRLIEYFCEPPCPVFVVNFLRQ